MLLRYLQAARRLGGLAGALPRSTELSDGLRVVCGPALWHAAAAQEVLRISEGCGCGAATPPLDASRGFCAAAGGGTEPAELSAPAAASPERESAAKPWDAGCSATLTPDASVARASPRAKRAPSVGVYGEKTASGRPKPDVRTVARLVELGWWDTAEEAEAMLTRIKVDKRFAFETAGPAIDWLLSTLGEEKHRSGRCLAAQAVYRLPLVLTCSTGLLKRGWTMVTLPREAGGLGLSEEVARRRVAKVPNSLVYYGEEFVQKRAAFLETLGIPDGRDAIARNLSMLQFAEDTLRRKAEWLRSQGLDVSRLLSAGPKLLGFTSESLSPKLDFLLNVAGLEICELLPAYLSSSLEHKLRPRFFYAMQRGAAQRFAFSSLVIPSDAAYLKSIDRPDNTAISVNEVAAFRAHIASPAFRSYMDEQEQAIRASRGIQSP